MKKNQTILLSTVIIIWFIVLILHIVSEHTREKKFREYFNSSEFSSYSTSSSRTNNSTTGSSSNKEEWYYRDGSPIVCRVSGCGKRPVYSNWDDRFCIEHLDRSANHASEYSPSVAKKKVNTEPALTKEQADALRGTGYHGTRPNSSAENAEIAAAMVKCKKCGMHSKNGLNILCYECQYNAEHGFD